MAEYIEREKAYELARTSELYSDFHRSMADLTSLKELLEDTPTADVVSSAVLEQVMWERDMALETLKEHGIGFCEKSDVVEVVRCEDCRFATELDKHCDINRAAYRHCSLWRGDETRHVWHKYKKYYKDYSIVDLDGFCSEGRRKEVANNG